MKVNRLTLRNFTAFEEAELEFSPGLNVLVGANGTGKSHVLKLLYSVLRPMTSTRPNGEANTEFARLALAIREKLQGTFRPDSDRGPLTSLIRRGAEKFAIRAKGDFGAIAIEWSHESNLFGPPLKGPLPTDPVIFIGTIEALSLYEGFIAAYEKRELPFDETYRDLCVDLSGTPLRKIPSPSLAAVAAQLDEAVGGKTRLKGGRFFVSLAKDWLLEASLLAEGLRKLGSLAHLIRNGSLAEKSVLLWDEPESNINPKLIPTVARALLEVAGADVQVFIATHDFLLTNELSLQAEYETSMGEKAKCRFFCLGREQAKEPVSVVSGATLADIPNNPILDEFAAHYDRERQLFYGNGTRKPE